MAGKRRGRHPKDDLDAKKVAGLIRRGAAGRHFDGGGLHLFIKAGGSASWVLRVSTNGKRRDLGLGGADSVSLADARETARQWRKTMKSGGDPLEEKRKSRQIPTFEQVARSVHAGHQGAWRNSKHAAQWLSTLEAYAFPELGSIRVDLVGVPEVLKALSPIWLTKPETARRVRQRIRTVLDVARAAGHRTTENPVGPVLTKALPKQTGRPGHHAAMPYGEVPGFSARLGDPQPGGEVTRLALRFLILTATRTGEVLGARRSEIDLERRVWTIPAERMKSGRDHRVPLSDAAVAVVGRALEISTDATLIFPGARVGKPLSNMALLMLCRRLGLNAVPHGFRSSFRDWASETTGFPAEVAEMALAHTIGNKTEAAYRRGDLFEKRRKLMEAWGRFVTSGVNVVALKDARGRTHG
jgi:integrase